MGAIGKFDGTGREREGCGVTGEERQRSRARPAKGSSAEGKRVMSLETEAGRRAVSRRKTVVEARTSYRVMGRGGDWSWRGGRRRERGEQLSSGRGRVVSDGAGFAIGFSVRLTVVPSVGHEFIGKMDVVCPHSGSERSRGGKRVCA